MVLEALPMSFAVCQTADFSQVDFDDAYCFAARTQDEWSLVCRKAGCPPTAFGANGAGAALGSGALSIFPWWASFPLLPACWPPAG